MRTARLAFLVILALNTSCKDDDEEQRHDPDFAMCADSASTEAFTDPLYVPPVAEATTNADGTLHYDLAAQQATHAFKACSTARAATYAYGGNEQLGPTLRVPRGQTVEVTVANQLAEPTSVHWHGLMTTSDVDITAPHLPPGQSATVRFTPDQPAATLWYHPHEHMKTGEQVFRGLAGILLLDDDANAPPGLPHRYGVDDFPLVVQDRRFSPDGQLEYLTYDDDDDGMLGNRVMVNGTLHPQQSVPPGLVRFRLLNLSNARFYAFALSNGQTFQQIASDGGLLASPVTLDTLALAPAERAEIVVDFAQTGSESVRLVSRAFQGPGGIDQDNHIGTESFHLLDDDTEKTKSGKPSADPDRRPVNGTPFELLELRVDGSLTPAPDAAVPDPLTSIPDPDVASAVNAGAPRQFLLENTDDDVINGQLFDENRVDQHVKQGTTEVWAIKNDATDLAHPFHVHGGQFRVLSRSMGNVAAGELGYKDTVTVLPGEEVHILVDFTRLQPGSFFFHCHILEHEDMGMMGIYSVDP